jgi:flagellin
MVDGINNSTGVLAALKALQTANSDMTQAENRVSSGKKVQSASDNAAAFQTSSIMSGEVDALQSATLSLGRAQSVSDISISAGQQVSTLLIDMKGTAASALNDDLTQDQRDAYNAQFQQQLTQLSNFVNNASFDGANVLNGSLPNGMSFVADADVNQSLTLKGRNLLPGGPTVTVGDANSLSTAEAAQQAYDAISTSITNVGGELSDMSAENKRVQAQSGFVSKLSDALTTGVGTLVDNDMEGDSALIQALQVKQSLAAQAVNIANNAPQSLLALFRP